MKWMMALLMLCGALPAAARDLPVPADKGWKHADTGLILRRDLAGLSRTGITDATENEHDVAVQFETADGGVFATIYVFHPAIADAALWFDRSQTALTSRDVFRHAVPSTADPVAFATGGAGAASSLRRAYGVSAGAYRSTALAVVPLGEWIVSLRMSARTLTADQLDARLQQVMAAIGWPMANRPAAAAVPIKDCGSPLSFGKARVIKPSGADLLTSLVAGTVAAAGKADDEAVPAATSWCRAGQAGADYGVYRADRRDGYILALQDAGRVVSVYPSLMGQIDRSGTYAVSLTDVDGAVSTYPSFTALPAPGQVWDLLASGQRTGTAKGNQITIDPKAL